MTNIVVDGRTITVDDKSTVLKALETLDIAVPTLCHLDGCETFTSCMVCVVKDTNSGKFVTSCSTPVYDGMRLETQTPEVKTARREALELLLSEHIGDCEAPCRRICPAFMDVPKMIRQVRDNHERDALITIKEHIAMPTLTGRLCHAPCEKGCRRGRNDAAVAICALERYVSDVDLVSSTPYVPDCKTGSDRKVAIVGAGPTGLAAAFYLLQDGHACTIFDQAPHPGGKLRTEVLEKQDLLPVLDHEIEILRKMGVVFEFNTTVGGDGNLSIAELKSRFDAVILAVGKVDPAKAKQIYNLPMQEKGFDVQLQTFSTREKGIFAGGDAVIPLQQVIRAMADGKSLADNVSHFLTSKELPEEEEEFDCRFGKLHENDMSEFMKEAQPTTRNSKNCRGTGGFSAQEATQEATRCIHCDCRKTTDCKLRQYATEYGVKQKAYASKERGDFSKDDSHPELVYEPGKCIRCGLCVRITATYSNEPGLTFYGRGFQTQIVVPFLQSLDSALKDSVPEIIAACPTGALAWKND